uniref:Trichome birefringence-like N-terminal domain-containing protein n=1 Tax=Solanum lycopersicum TaxID=4081 RepID=A0A3Q7FJ96_SOLLC
FIFLLDYTTVDTTGSHLRGHSFFVIWFGLNDSSLVLKNSSSRSRNDDKVGFFENDCDIFDGNWVWDESYPLYLSEDCMFLDEGFCCSENGRPDNFYTKWRWQPKDCNLPRQDTTLYSATCERNMCVSLCIQAFSLQISFNVGPVLARARRKHGENDHQVLGLLYLTVYPFEARQL